MKKLIWLFPALLIFGCEGKVPVEALHAIKGDAEITRTVSTSVMEASTFKEAVTMQTLQNRDNVRDSMYEKSGLKLEWKPVTETIKIITPNEKPIIVEMTKHLPDLTFRSEPRFQFALPTKPSKHPIWATVDNVVNKGLIGAGLYFLSDVWKDSIDGARGTTTTYNGPLIGSQNTTVDGATQTLGPVTLIGDDQNILENSQNTNPADVFGVSNNDK